MLWILLSKKYQFLIVEVGLILARRANYMDCYNSNLSEWIGSISTIVSIALSIISMVNSCITENKTSKILEDIKQQNTRLVDMINYTLGKDNYDDNNINSLKVKK